MLFVILFQMFLYTITLYKLAKVKNKLNQYINSRKHGKEEEKEESEAIIWNGYYKHYGMITDPSNQSARER